MSYVGGITGGVVERFLPGDVLTCHVAAGQSVSGGDVVEFTGDRVVQAAGADSLVVAGVALHDAAATKTVSVAMVGVWPVKAAGAVSAGARVVAAPAGDVKASGAAPDARTVLGVAIEGGADTTIIPVKLNL